MKLTLEIDVAEINYVPALRAMAKGLLQGLEVVPDNSDIATSLAAYEEQYMILAEAADPDDITRMVGRLVLHKTPFDSKNFTAEQAKKHDVQIETLLVNIPR